MYTCCVGRQKTGRNINIDLCCNQCFKDEDRVSVRGKKHNCHKYEGHMNSSFVPHCLVLPMT